MHGHDKLGRLVAGHSEYAARRRRIALVEKLLLDYAPTPSQVQLLAIVAQHLDDSERARSAERRIRASNTARRLLKDIPRKKAEQPTIFEILKGQR